MQSKTSKQAKQEVIQPKSQDLEFSKSSKTSQASKKRKENPVELKYEGNTDIPVPDEEHELPKLDKDNRKNFDYIYEKIKEMRKHRNAAVDNHGCQISGQEVITKEDKDFQTLCSLLLSVQNRDESTGAAMVKLRAFGLTIDVADKIDEDVLLGMIKEVNFNRTKAKNIKAAAKITKEKYNGRVPDDLEKLLEFPGVGYKIGILYLNTCHNMNVGIGVDTHVHRISNRLGWVKTDKPNDTRTELEKFVPRKEWSDINCWLVGFGQQVCLPKNPKCETCLLNNVCPEGKRNMRYHKKGKSAEKTTEVKSTKKVKKTSPSPKVKKVGAKIEEQQMVTYVNTRRKSRESQAKNEMEEVSQDIEEVVGTPKRKKVSGTRKRNL